MTVEQLKQALKAKNKIDQCNRALEYPTTGTYFPLSSSTQALCELPEEVGEEIREVIKKWKSKYETEFEQL